LSDLSYIEKTRLEKLFEMSGGYVLHFTNRTFQEFVVDSVRRDIYCGKYDYASNSKANLLRRFWEVEPNHIVGKILDDLVGLAREQSPYREDKALLDDCVRIAERLLQGASAEDLEAIGEELSEKEFDLLVKSIRASIDANEPEAGLDRLHTFVTKFLRRLCEKRGISVSKDKPLHSLMGEYIRKMKADGAIETQMTERILKSSIANLEAFNAIRNEYSFAHDNPILNYEESLLIINHVVSVIRFIKGLERQQVG
jgi:hypothetical protein